MNIFLLFILHTFLSCIFFIDFSFAILNKVVLNSDKGTPFNPHVHDVGVDSEVGFYFHIIHLN